MPITVSGPDGTEVEFPDGTSTDTIRTAMQKHYGAPSGAAPAEAQPDNSVTQWAGTVGHGLAAPGIAALGGPAGELYLQGSDLFTGLVNAVGQPLGMQRQVPLSEVITNTTDKLGLTRAPQTDLQRIAAATANAGTSAQGSARALTSLAGELPAGVNYMRELMTAAGAQPRLQMTAGAAAGASGQGAAELGLPPWAQQLAGAAGGVGAGLLGGALMTPKAMPADVPSVADLANAKNAAYADMEKAGARYSTTDVKGLVQQMKDALPGLNVELGVPDSINTFFAKAAAHLKEMGAKETGPTQLDRLRRMISDAGTDADSGRIASAFKTMLDDFVETPENTLNSKRAGVSQARVALSKAEQDATAAQDAVNASHGDPSARGPLKPQTVPVDLGWSSARKAANGVDQLDVAINPTNSQLARMAVLPPEARGNNGGKRNVRLRFLRDADGNVYAWRGDLATHEDVAQQMNLPIDGVQSAVTNGGPPLADTGMIDIEKGRPVFQGGVAPPPNPQLVAAADAAKQRLAAAEQTHREVTKAWADSDPSIKPLVTRWKNAQDEADAQARILAALPKKTSPEIRLKAEQDAAKTADVAAKARTTLDAKHEQLAPADPQAIAKAGEALTAQQGHAKTARELATRQANTETIHAIQADIENARRSGIVPDEAGIIRTNLRRLMKKPAFRRFSADDKAAVEAMMKPGAAQSLAEFVGSFTPGGGGARSLLGMGLDVAGLMTGPAGAVGTMAVAPTARSVANHMATTRLEALANHIAAGRTVVPPSVNYAPRVLPGVVQPFVNQNAMSQ